MTFKMDDNIYNSKIIKNHDYAIDIIEKEFERLLEDRRNINKDEVEFHDKKISSLMRAYYAINESIKRGL